MKTFALMLAAVAALLTATPAFADSARLVRLLNATQTDFEATKTSFREACRTGGPGWQEYRKTVATVSMRIAARRVALSGMRRTAMKDTPPGQRGLTKMLARDLDQINVTFLALIKDEKGYAGYLRTRSDDMVKGISDWQEGIRQALAENRRCIKMMARVHGQYMAAAAPVPAH